MSDAGDIIDEFISENIDVKDDDNNETEDINKDDNNVAAPINWDDFIDERDEIEWTDEFRLNEIGKGQYKSSESHRWLGADWTLLIQGNRESPSYGIFVGYDNSSHFPPYWYANVLFEFIIISDDGTEKSIFCDTNCFEASEVDRTDRGSGNLLDRKYLMNNDEVKIKVKLKEYSTKLNMSLLQKKNYDSKIATDMVGLINNGATCYLNSLLQMLFNINKFRHAVYQLPHDDEVFSESTTLALQSVFKNLQNSKYQVSTNELTTAFGWSNQDADIQQDVQEMMRVLLDKLEEKMKGTVVEGAIKSLFAGKFCSYIRCVNVPYESKREEDFYDIQLEVKNCKNIYESLKKYTEVETLDGENQYDAGDFGKQDARKGVDFTSFPPVLTIHLKRFDFDFSTMNFIKIHDNYEFPAYLDLDEYLSKDPTANCQKNNKYLLHSVLVHAGDVGGGHYYAYIRPSKGYDYAASEENMKNAKEALNKLPNGLSPSNMTVEEARIKLASDGAGGKWYKFNDEVVTTAQSKEAIQFCFGTIPIQNKKPVGRVSGSAYMLVYIKESMAAEIMNEEQCEIPSLLIDRLDKECMRRELASKQQERQKMFQTFKFATEISLAESKPGLEPHEFVYYDPIIRGSSHMYALLKIAKKLKQNPLNIRLWSCNLVTEFQIYCAKELIHVNDYDSLFSEYYYVEILHNINNNEISSVDDVLNDELKLIEKFKNELESLELDENEIKEYLVGLGIGGSSKALNIISDQTARKDLEEELNNLTNIMHQVLRVDDSEKSLIFIKLYDFQDILPKHIWQPATSLKRSLSDEDNILILETLKYMGSRTLQYDILNKSPHDVITDVLKTYEILVKTIAGALFTNEADRNRFIAELCDDLKIYYSFGFRSYPYLIYSKEGDEGITELGDFKAFRSGAEFSFSYKELDGKDINWQLRRYIESGAHYDDLRYLIHFFKYRRFFKVNPCGQRDKDIINRCKNKENPQKRQETPLKKIKLDFHDDESRGKDDENIYENDSADAIVAPFYLSLKTTFEILSEMLKISPARLVLFLTNDKEIGMRDYVYPLTYILSEYDTIKTIAEKLRIPKTANKFYYMISPYDVVDPRLGILKLCLHINDSKSRMHRRQIINSTDSHPVDSEFIEDEVVYVSIQLYSDLILSDFIDVIKSAIGIPISLNGTEEVEISEFEYSHYNSILSEPIIHQESEKFMFPTYPLITYLVEPLHDMRIISSSPPFLDQLRISDYRYGGLCLREDKMCIQHVSRGDLGFMLKTSDSSILVVVCNFTLNGKAAEPCDNFGMPFLSYLKMDDDYDSLASRFVEVTGDQEILKLRLAVIEDKIPQFFTRSSTSENAAIWSLINLKSPVVWFGIQRSAASIVSTRKVIGSITIK